MISTLQVGQPIAGLKLSENISTLNNQVNQLVIIGRAVQAALKQPGNQMLRDLPAAVTALMASKKG